MGAKDIVIVGGARTAMAGGPGLAILVEDPKAA